jgi:hypothetical protein
MPRPFWPTPADLVFSAEGDLPDLKVRARSLLLLAAFAVLIYLSLVPALLRTSSPPTGDQPFYLMDAISLVKDGDLDVANNYADRDEDFFYSRAPRPPGFLGQPAPYPLPPHLILSPARPASEQYDYHAPGLAILIVPAWIIGSWFHLWWPATVVFMCLVGALVAVNVFLLAFQASGDDRIAWMVWAAMTFSAPLICYSLLIFTELPVSLLILYAFRRFSVGWGANRPWQLALAGICVAFIPWLSWRCGTIAAALGVYGIIRWWRFLRLAKPSEDRRAATAAFLIVPMLLSALAIALYGHFLTGKLLPDIRYRAGGESADLFHWPWNGGRDLMLTVSGAMALLFDQQWGLLVHSPVYLLAFVGLLAMDRPGGNAEHRQLAWLAFVSVPYLFVISAFKHWGGLWCPPGRYLLPLVPLFALPLARSLRVLVDIRAYRVVFLLLTLLGFSYVVLVTSDLHLMWPASRGYFWEWLSRKLPGGLDLRNYFPAFGWPDGRRPFKSAWMFGSATALVLLFHALMPPKQPAHSRVDVMRRRVAGWAGTVVLVGMVWLVVNADSIGSPLANGVKRWLGLPP